MGALAAHPSTAALGRAQCIVQHTLYVPGHLVDDEPMTRGVTLAANCLAQAGGEPRRAALYHCQSQAKLACMVT